MLGLCISFVCMFVGIIIYLAKTGGLQNGQKFLLFFDSRLFAYLLTALFLLMQEYRSMTIPYCKQQFRFIKNTDKKPVTKIWLQPDERNCDIDPGAEFVVLI